MSERTTLRKARDAAPASNRALARDAGVSPQLLTLIRDGDAVLPGRHGTTGWPRSATGRTAAGGRPRSWRRAKSDRGATDERRLLGHQCRPSRPHRPGPGADAGRQRLPLQLQFRSREEAENLLRLPRPGRGGEADRGGGRKGQKGGHRGIEQADQGRRTLRRTGRPSGICSMLSAGRKSGR